MRWIVCRAALVVTVAGGVTAVAAGPALATGQFYHAPGFTNSNASCMGSASDFGAHYGVTGEGWPDAILHGEIGPSESEHATSDGPGAVGEFSSSMAASHGSILTCLS